MRESKLKSFVFLVFSHNFRDTIQTFHSYFDNTIQFLFTQYISNTNAINLFVVGMFITEYYESEPTTQRHKIST